MTLKAEAQESRFDLLKWLVVVALIVVGIVGNQYYSAQPILYRVLVLLVLAGVAAFVGLQTARGKAFFVLAKEARAEIRGFICPGMPLMRGQLRTHTRRIRYDDAAAEEAHSSFAPGRSTAEAVERGCALMLRGFAVSQLELAHQHWGDDFVVFVTGGDAELVKGVTPGARLVPDLVFVGLALACPLL